jgi:hypothetical protein
MTENPALQTFGCLAFEFNITLHGDICGIPFRLGVARRRTSLSKNAIGQPHAEQAKGTESY